MKRCGFVAGVAGLCLLGGLLLGNLSTASGTAPKKTIDFTLPDSQGKKVTLADFKDCKAVVVVFLGTECPINNLYLPRLNQLQKEFAGQGVQFLGINSNQQDTPERIAAHARKHDLIFPVLYDRNNVVADLMGARRTPEAFILDRQRKICYQGRIDDRFGIDYQRSKATRDDLVEALREVLAGKQVTVATTPVAGCLIGRVRPVTETGKVTYTKHVAPILQQRCQECHRPGQIGPMSLLTYEDARNWSDMIREVVEERRMPPWHADPRFGKWSNDRSLTAKERQTLLAWIDAGTPRGDLRDMPPPREFTPGWKIGKPDMVLTMPVEFEVPAETPPLGVPYKYFSVQTNFEQDMWVERAETKAGAPEVVHHIIVFVVPPGERFRPENPKTPALSGTAPGDMPLILPKGYAKKVPRGSRLLFQMHYTPNGKAQKDRSQVGLIFANQPPEKEVLTFPIYNIVFRIPPGAAHHRVESSMTMHQDGWIVGFMPHMHLRGKDFLYRAVFPDGKTQTLLSVPQYNFNWQSIYRPQEPIQVPKGTRIECVAHFDNSPANPNNPDPTKAVFWGNQTWQEMMVGWIDIAFERK